MNRQFFLNELYSIEESLCVDEWKEKDVDFWPIFRITYGFNCSNNYSSSTVLKKLRIKKVSIINRVSQAFICYIKLLFNLKKQQIVFIGSLTGYVNIDGTYYNRVLDPLRDRFEEKKEHCISIINEGYFGEKAKYNVYGIEFLKVLICSIVFFQSFFIKNLLKKKSKKYYILLRDKLSIDESLLRAIINKSILYCYRIALSSFILKHFLFFNKPKKVYISCYYSNFLMCVIYACKINSIPTVDVQHGVQDYNHFAYGRWNNVPKEGYNVLPDEFYCYSEKERLIINDWIKQNKCLGHKVKIVGNLWLDKWNNSSTYSQKIFELLNALKKSYGNKKVALITMQDLNTFLDTAWFLNVIKKLSKEWLWMIRLHPGNKNVPEILNAFKNIDSVELSLATKLPLPVLIQFADIHITGNSTCVEDSAYFKKKSIIIHPTGKQYYGYLIERGDAILALTEKDAVRAINNIL